MTIATHQFPSAEKLEHRYRRSLAMIAQVEPMLELETSDKRYGCRLLCEESQTCGTIASVLMSDGDVPQASEHALAIHYFYDALLTTLAFGDVSALAEFAAFPEAGYRSPNMVASESVYAAVRAFQAWPGGR